MPDEKIFVAVTGTKSLQSKRQIVNQYSTCTPVEVILERERERYPDRWIYLILGRMVKISAPNSVWLPGDDAPTP